jgi:hypothetical protein
MYWAEKYSLRKNNESLIDGTEKTGHEVNADKPEHIFLSCEENVEKYHNIKVSNIFCFVWA